MTWFSRMSLNPQRRGGRHLLSNPQAMHAAVMSAFPPRTLDEDNGRGRVLWRVDSQHPEHTLYVVSPVEPDLEHIVEQAGWSTVSWESTDYTRFLDQLRMGQQWRFRLRANPVKSVKAGEGPRGKVLPHVTPAQQLKWLDDRAPKSGFALLREQHLETDSEVLLTSVVRREDRQFHRQDDSKGTRVTLRQAQFEGAVAITDVAAFRRTLIYGIGRGKAYGCGLMTLRRL